MEIRKTRPEDIDRIMEIYAHARKFMREHDNLNQWADGRPFRYDIEKDIEALSEIISRDEFNKEVFNALKEIKINLIFELNREDHISESEKTHFVSLIENIIDAMKEYRVNYRQGLLSEYYEALNSDVEIMRTVPQYQEIIAATHQKSLIMEGKNKVHNFK